MKKQLIGVVGLVGLGLSFAWAGHFTDILPPSSTAGCVPVSNGYDYNCTTDSGSPVIVSSAPVQLFARTLNAINVLTPSATGQIVYCNNCINSVICVSSGTGAGAWVGVSSTVVSHCN